MEPKKGVVFLMFFILSFFRGGAGQTASVFNCGRRPLSSRVVSGENAVPHSWPWQAQQEINIRGYFQHMCGATLVHPRFVVTAAHCVNGLEAYQSRMRIRLGVHNKTLNESSQQIFRIIRITIHPEYNRPTTINNDVAVLELDRPATLNDKVGLACLPPQGHQVRLNSLCYISGWGRLYGGGPSSSVLQQARMPIVTNYQCEVGNAQFQVNVTSKMLCAGFGGSSTVSGCHGDSGGPFVCQDSGTGRWYLEGSVSWGSPQCAARTTYTVFARIGEFRRFIDNAMLPRPSVAPTTPPRVYVRLGSQVRPGRGRVEIFYNGRWGTVCDDFFTDRAAEVVCGMLGYPRRGATQIQRFGGGSDPIWLDNVQCTGNENSITECQHQPFGSNDCSHTEDVGVDCSRQSTSPPFTGTQRPTRPPCPPVSTQPPPVDSANCDFESGMCGYGFCENTTRFIRYRGRTPSQGTGPSADHTTGSGYYIYMETSGPMQRGDKARVESPSFRRPSGRPCLTFWYHMYGSSMGSLRVYLNSYQGLLWEVRGDQGNQWRLAQIPLDASQHYNKIMFEGIRGGSYESDIAIDDIVVSSNYGCSLQPSGPPPTPPYPGTTHRPFTSPRPPYNASCNLDWIPCRFYQFRDDNMDFTINTHSTPSSNTGPSGDHTTGAGRYYYLEASGRREGERARMAMRFSVNYPACIYFHYHMYGARMGYLRVLLDSRLVWQLHGNQGNQWIKATFPIRSAGTYMITVEGIVGPGFTSDMAVDDFGFQEMYHLTNDACGLTPSCANPTGQGPPPPPPPTPSGYVTPPHSPQPPSNGSCGIPSVPHSRVIGGVDARPGSWPWQVGLYVQETMFICGGSLIAPRWVLTAAHCIRSSWRYKIVLGDHNRNVNEGSEQSIYGQRLIVHPSWNRGTIDNDVALIYMSRPALLNDRVKTVCLPRQGEHVPPGTDCYITGWGKIRHPGSSYTILQQARLPVVNQTYCQQKLASSPGVGNLRITDNMICGGEEGSIKSGCHGDSGGPFVCRGRDGRWVLQGDVSWGSPRCNTRERFTVFARLGRYRNWINSIMRSAMG